MPEPGKCRPPAPKPKQGSSKLMLPIVVAAATLLGGVMGVVVVAPRVIASRMPATTSEADSGAAQPAHEPAGEQGPLFTIDNLIVNPAGSLGSRFLMISVAIETPNAKVEETLRKQEPRIRDMIIALLERQTMEMLSQVGARDSLKAQLADTIATVYGGGARLRLFLPQFVIQ